MNRHCFALSLLLASLATATLAVSQARCQPTVEWSDEAHYGCPYWVDDLPVGPACLEEAEEQAAAPAQFAGDDDHAFEDYGYEGYYEFPSSDSSAAEATGDSPTGDSLTGDALTDDERYEYEAYGADDLDPEYEYADDYAPYEYENGYDDEVVDVDDPALGVEDGRAAAGVVEPQACYSYRSEHDPVYDDVMFDDASDEDASDEDAPSANDDGHPQSWDDYDYDAGYDYENPYEDWYADDIGKIAPPGTASNNAALDDGALDDRALHDGALDDGAYEYDEYAGEWNAYDDSEFDKAYDEYWSNSPATTKTDGRASACDWEDCYGNCWFDFGHSRQASEANQRAAEMAARHGAECVALGAQARNAVLLLVAGALDRVGGVLQDASHDLTRIARGESSSASR